MTTETPETTETPTKPKRSRRPRAPKADAVVIGPGEAIPADETPANAAETPPATDRRHYLGIYAEAQDTAKRLRKNHKNAYWHAFGAPGDPETAALCRWSAIRPQGRIEGNQEMPLAGRRLAHAPEGHVPAGEIICVDCGSRIRREGLEAPPEAPEIAPEAPAPAPARAPKAPRAQRETPEGTGDAVIGTDGRPMSYDALADALAREKDKAGLLILSLAKAAQPDAGPAEMQTIAATVDRLHEGFTLTAPREGETAYAYATRAIEDAAARILGHLAPHLPGLPKKQEPFGIWAIDDPNDPAWQISIVAHVSRQRHSERLIAAKGIEVAAGDLDASDAGLDDPAEAPQEPGEGGGSATRLGAYAPELTPTPADLDAPDALKLATAKAAEDLADGDLVVVEGLPPDRIMRRPAEGEAIAGVIAGNHAAGADVSLFAIVEKTPF